MFAIGGIYRSTDNGDDWTQINNGLTNLFVQSLAINSSGHIFAGTRGGVFRSMNHGDDWMPINTGLTNSDVTRLAINSSGYIFFGNQWWRGLPECSVNDCRERNHWRYPSLVFA